MAAARPVVASRVGGLPELVEHEVTGLLVPPEDPAALAAALRRLLGDAATRARMGAAARSRAADFSIPRLAGAVRGIYDRLLV